MSRPMEVRPTNRVAMVAVATARIFAPVWLLPAVLINVDWAIGASVAWNLGAAGSILASAVFVEAASRSDSWRSSLLFATCAALLILTNLQIAFDNASQRSADRSDLRQAQIVAASRASSQRELWSQERNQAIKIVGFLPAAFAQGNIDRLLSENATRWRSTSACNPEQITAPTSVRFCSELAALRAKLAAAKQRDELTKRIGNLDVAASGAVTPTSPDAFLEGATTLLTDIGLVRAETAKSLLRPLKDLLRAFSLELVAAFGPSAWLLLFSKRPSPAHIRIVRNNSHSTRQRLSHTDDTADEGPKKSPVHRFVSSQIEIVDGASLRAGAAWMAYQAWCAKERIPPGTQKRFGSQMKTLFAHDRNNNRPRYLGAALISRQGGEVNPSKLTRSMAKVC